MLKPPARVETSEGRDSPWLISSVVSTPRGVVITLIPKRMPRFAIVYGEDGEEGQVATLAEPYERLALFVPFICPACGEPKDCPHRPECPETPR